MYSDFVFSSFFRFSFHFCYLQFAIANSNQSARELSHFAESAMAVKRVIMQHFSMKYDYMNKERPNIYHPSRAGARADTSITKASHNRSVSNDDNDDDDTLLPNSNQSLSPTDAPINDSVTVSGTQLFTLNHTDDDVNGVNSDENEHGKSISDLDYELNSRMVTAPKKQMPSIEEQLNDAVRSLNEHQLHSNPMNNRRSQTALKIYATSNGLGSIIEKLSVDDSDANSASPVGSPLKKSQVIVKNSGLDANAKNVPSSNIRNEVQDSHVQQKKPMAINTRNDIRPEENWRYRSNSNSLENKQPTSKLIDFLDRFLN